jgi:prolipoprotein diacylglyceryltransferase
MEEKRTTTPSKNIAAYIVGMVFIAVGITILLRREFIISFTQFLSITLMAVGIVLIITYLCKHKKTKS